MAPTALRRAVGKAALASLAAACLPALAAPGPLAQQPLFLGTQTPPNIVFVIDDSGSMDWEVMTRDFANGGLAAATQPDGRNPLARFYMQDAAPDVSVATHRGGWDSTASVLQRRLSLTKAGSSQAKAVAEGSSTNDYDTLMLKLVSDPLPSAQTLSGSLQWVVGAKESGSGMNARWHVHAYVVEGDSDTVRGTLHTDYIGADEWTTTARGEAASFNVTPVAAAAGDRIVIEVGYRAQNGSSTAYTGTLYYGGTGSTDLSDNSTSVTSRPGWWAFDQYRQRDNDDDGSADCTFADGTYYGYLYGTEFGSSTYLGWTGSNSCNTADDEDWRFRNSGYNPLYFDPAKVYTPWSGVDATGAPFADIAITNAPDNPYAPTEYIDLTRHSSGRNNATGARKTADRDGDGQPDGFRYYTWSDTNGNGDFDNGEQTEYLIKDADAATQQNFANWFSYYRSRMLAAKAAYGRVIAEAENVRMGLVTINGAAQREAVRSVSGDPASGGKRELLDALYGTQANGSTPLRTAFYQTGRYLECATNSYFGSCPALPVEHGGACQQNFAVVMTDGFYNDTFSSTGNTDGNNNTVWDGGAYADSYSNTLGDIAMHFYERDLSALADKVPTKEGVDEAEHQHVVTYTVAFGVDGTLTVVPTDPDAAFVWPDPTDGDAEKVDDLRHAAYNGRGLFLNAADPDTLSVALGDAIADIAKRSGSAAAVAFNTTSLQTDSVLYLALFDSTRWSGNLLAYPLDDNGLLAATPQWEAATVLDGRDLGAQPRTILTYDGSDGVPFRWASLTAAQKDDLRRNPSGGSDGDAIAQARLDFLRGARNHEGSGYAFRMRSSRLGDLVYSAPVYVGRPELGWPEAASGPFAASGPYSTFKTAQAGRRAMVYVGANDGMLHGFDAEDGQERLAYVPGPLYSTDALSGLHYLTDPGYQHRYYVDLAPTISDVVLQGAWKSVLIGGLRGGGRGYFALDVTDPAGFAEAAGAAQSTVLWEFHSGHDADLGASFAQPSIVPLNNGKWAAVFGNGYNDTGSGRAQLFIVYLEEGLDGSWAAGDYLKLDTALGSAADPNGLGSPALVDLDGDMIPDRAYAGDLRGNLWAFDIGSANAAGWGVAYKQGATPKPLFTTATGQPITTMPVVTRNTAVADAVGNGPNLLVFFGTGQFMLNSDPGSTTTQSFYSVWDRGVREVTQADLVEQVITTTGLTRSISANPVTFGPSVLGCYMDLPDSGERVVTDAAVRGDLIYFNTLVPSSEVCSAGGYGWLMATRRDCSPPPGDGPITAGQYVDAPPAEPRFLGIRQYTSTSDDEEPVHVRELEPLPGPRTGRLSWQELSP